MTKPKVYLYNHRFTGDVVPMTKAEARKKLNEDWSRIKPVTNDKGERVLRMQLNGATVDISQRSVGAIENGNGNSK
jgi:hypothetical protein